MTMTIREHILAHEINVRYARSAYSANDIWDVIPAPNGVTVFMTDGTVLPLPMSQAAATELLRQWSLNARAN